MLIFNKKEKENLEHLLEAIRLLQYNEVKQLLESGIDPSRRVKLFDSFESPLVASIRAESVELVKLLLSFGVSANEIGKDGLTALQVACYSGQVEIVDVLLKYKADVLFYKREPFCLAIACFYDNEILIKLLLENGAIPSIPHLWKTSWFRFSSGVLTLLIGVADKVPEEVLTFWKADLKDKEKVLYRDL